jgi:hypothetical protein
VTALSRLRLVTLKMSPRANRRRVECLGVDLEDPSFVVVDPDGGVQGGHASCHRKVRARARPRDGLTARSPEMQATCPAQMLRRRRKVNTAAGRVIRQLNAGEAQEWRSSC